MSELQSSYVKLGYWVNQERGTIMGQTVTTKSQVGPPLIALLAILVTIATARLWNLVAFILYQIRSDGQPCSTLSRQQQVLLRTLPTPVSVTTDSFKLWWAWRKKAARPLMDIFPLAIIALLFAVATATASIFSSFVISTSNIEVLVSSPHCGSYNKSSRVDGHLRAITANYTPKVNDLAQIYASHCYLSYETPEICKTFIRPRIPFSHTRSPCPWNESMCLGDENPAVVLDSGLLDMNTVFGMNLPDEEGVRFRRKTSCAILPVEGRTEVVNASDYPKMLARDPLPEERILMVFYGGHEGGPEYTFAYSLAQANISVGFGMGSMAYFATPERKTSAYIELLPELRVKDADAALKMLTKSQASYWNPVDDPMFAAHQKKKSDILGEYYISDFPITTVQCAQQYQFCTAQRGKSDTCTGLIPLPYHSQQTNLTSATPLQTALLQHIIASADVFYMISPIYTQLESSLTTGKVFNGAPPDQWIKEIVGWESHVWAALQMAITDYAVGPKARDSGADIYAKYPSTDGGKRLCGMQRMRRSGGFANINVFGLAFTVAFTCFIVIVDISLLKFLIFLSTLRRTKTLGPRINRWIQDGVFQLQRRAYESQGCAYWEDLDEDIPTTRGNEKLPGFSEHTAKENGLGMFAPLETVDTEIVLSRKGTFSNITRNSTTATFVESPQATKGDTLAHDQISKISPAPEEHVSRAPRPPGHSTDTQG